MSLSADEDTTDDATTVFSVLGIRIPEEQRAKIREAAKIEDRTESSFARYHLSKAADAVIAANQQPAHLGDGQ